MLEAMTTAELGDDVYGDDPTVNKLEDKTAELLGFEAALFTASGTQANLVAIMSHCKRGDEYIVGQQAHTYKYEAGGAAVLGSVQPQPIDFEPNATLDLGKVKEKIKPDDFHFARTRLLCLENTHNGKALPLEYLREAADFCGQQNLLLHLDGARLCNAAVEQQVSLQQITKNFDSATLCLSKGLGAPVGSMLCGSRPFIEEARKWRKMVGGGMRQAGILAAAGIYALDHNISRLAEDHTNGRLLADSLRRFEKLTVDLNQCQTNMTFFSAPIGLVREMARFLQQRGILITPRATTRLATHLDINREDIVLTIDMIGEFFEQ